MESMRNIHRWIVVAGIVCAAMGLSMGRVDPPSDPATEWVAPLGIPPTRPASGDVVRAGTALQPLLDAAPAGAIFCLEPGTYAGPLTISKPVTLWGPPTAVIRSQGQGSTVSIRANDVALLGLTIDGSGGRYDLLDAAVRIQGNDVRVEGITIANSLFGVLAEKSTRVTVRGNQITGPRDGPIGLRGDGIRFWETRESLIDGNRVNFGRDVVIWYSSDNRIANNIVCYGRYGTHFMYSHNNIVEDNRYEYDTVGIFIMYSTGVILRRNRLSHASGAAGIGLGIKESGNLTVTDNVFLHDTVGIYLDTSPLRIGDFNHFTGNDVRFCAVGVQFHSSQKANRFEGNNFRDNTDQVRVDGGGDVLGIEWVGNYFDDYRGYDLDDDGIGDVPYELRKLSSTLTSRNDSLQFFSGTPALALADMASHVSPLYQPKLILTDATPRTAPITRPRNREEHRHEN